MKTNKQSQKQRTIAISPGYVLPGEQKIIFRRLKPPPIFWRRIKLPFSLFLSFIHQAEIHRIMDPEKPPVPEHEWRRPTIFRSKI